MADIFLTRRQCLKEFTRLTKLWFWSIRTISCQSMVHTKKHKKNTKKPTNALKSSLKIPHIKKFLYGGSKGSPYLLNQKCYRADSMIFDLDETCLVINNTKFVKNNENFPKKHRNFFRVSKK